MVSCTMSRHYGLRWIVKQICLHLERHVYFIPRCGNIDNLEPNQIAIHLAQTPTWKTIAQNIQAMDKSTFTNPLINKKSFKYSVSSGW